MPATVKILNSLTLLLILAMAGFAIYARAMASPFLFFDDHFAITSNESFFHQGLIPAFSHIFATNHNISDRPVTALSIWFNYKASGIAPWGFRVGNVLLHVLTAFALYFLCLRWPGVSKASIPAAGAAALLFLVHPMNLYAVQVLVAERCVLLAGLFGILSLIAFFEYADTLKNNFLCISLTCLALSVLSKPDGLAFLLIIWTYSRFKQIKLPLFSYIVFFFLFALPLVFFLMGLHPQKPCMIWYEYLSVQTRVVLAYLWLFFWPFNSYTLNQTSPDPNIFLHWTWAAILLHGGILIGTLRYLRRYDMPVCFAIICVYLSFVPESSVFPLQVILLSYRTYLPYIFLSLLVYLFVVKMPRPKMTLALLGCVCLCFAVTTSRLSARLTSQLGFNIELMKRYTSDDILNYKTLCQLITEGKNDTAIHTLKYVLPQHRPNQKIYEAVYILLTSDGKPLGHDEELLIKTYFLQNDGSKFYLSCLLKLINQIVKSPTVSDPDSFKHDIFFKNIEYILNDDQNLFTNVGVEFKNIDQRLINRYSAQKILTDDEEWRFDQTRAALRLLSMPPGLSNKEKFERLYKENPNWKALFNQ